MSQSVPAWVVAAALVMLISTGAATATAAIPPVSHFSQYDLSDGEEYPTKADLINPVIDDFEDADVSDWSVFATQNAAINLSCSDNSKSGSYSMRIGCNVSGPEANWCGVYRQVDTWVNYDNVSLWVYGDNSNNTLEIKLEETYSEEWWSYTSIIDWNGWEKLVIPLSSFVAGGGADGISDKSKINRFTLVVAGNSPPGSTIYVDDIRLELSDMPVSDDDFLEMVEHDTFNYFWSEVNQTNGLIRDRSTPDSPCSIASVGFGLSAICIAESRGWVNRTDASDRILTTLETFNDLYNKEGFYYHWINMSTGAREWDCEVSSIDTALLMAGVLHAGEHFKENESIRTLSNELYERVNWTWMLNGTDTITMKWTPEEGLSPGYWRGYNEAMIMYLLAIGSPTHPVPDPKGSWDAWASTYGRDCGRMVDGFEGDNVSDWVTFADSGSGASIDTSRSNNSKIGDYSMKIDYTIGGGTDGERCGTYLQKSTWANYDSVNLWIYGDNSSNILRIKIEEDCGKEYWIYELPLNWTGWNELDIPVSSFRVWEPTMQDGVLDKTKVNRFTIAILESDASTSGSTIYVDDFKLPCSASDGCDGEDFIYCYTGSLFTYQYSHCWIDFRCKHDGYANYWQNSINAVRENRLFCIDNSDVYVTYGENCWGLTACDGSYGYTNHGSYPCYCHDGTIPPTGAGGSVALAPGIAIPALRYMYETYGGKIWSTYGFKDAFNLDTNISLGGCQPWWTDEYIGIDEGAIMLMIENHRSGMVWREFMQNQYVRHAMAEAGFVPAIRGDINGDCALTPADAAIALQLAACGECAAGASADPRTTSPAPAAGMTSVPIAQASTLGMSVTDGTCKVVLDARYGDAEAQEAVVTLTLTNTGHEYLRVYPPALPSPGEGITLAALDNYPIAIPSNGSKTVRINVRVAGDVAEGTYNTTAYFGDSTATITINVRRLTSYNLDCEIADVSGDGQVTSLDALMILQMAEVHT